MPHEPDHDPSDEDPFATTGVGDPDDTAPASGRTGESSDAVTLTTTGRAPKRRKPRPAIDERTLAMVGAARYDIRGEHGRGGIGRILIARDRQLGRAVALKELMTPTAAAEARFFREALITGRLEHPSIVPVHELGRLDNGKPYYAMKLIEGRTLKELLGEAQSAEQRRELIPHVVAVCDAVAYAHSKGVVHRDLKPSNIIVGDYGETVVVDWGLAKVIDESDDGLAMNASGEAKKADDNELTMVGQILGTPAYMPPEQARGEDVSEAADVYALGAILYHVLTDALPHAAPTTDETLAKVRSGTRASVLEREPSTPRDLAAIVDKAMATHSFERYPTARELAADLRRYRANRLVSAYRYSRAERVGRWIGRHRALSIATACFAVLAMVAAAWFVAREQRLRRTAEDARDSAETAQSQAEQARDEADRQSLALLEQQGRIELDSGRPGRAAVLLVEAFARQPDDRETHALITESMRQLEVVDREFDLTGHRDQVSSIAYSPDGSRVVTASADATVRVWDATNGAQIFVLDHDSRLRGAAYSGDGRVIATASEGAVRLWNAETGALIEVLDERSRDMASLALNHDHSLLAMGSYGGAFVLWDARQGTLIREVKSAAGWIVGTAFAHKGAVVVTASIGGEINLWDTATGSLLRTIQQEGQIYELSVSIDGARIATGGRDGIVRVFDVDSGTLQIALPHGTDVSSVAFYGASGHIATGTNNGTLRLWSPTGGFLAAVDTVKLGTIVGLAVSPDGKHLIVGDDAGNASAWRIATERFPRRYAIADWAENAEYDPTGRLIAVADQAGDLRVVDATTGDVLWSVKAYPENTWIAEWRPDGAELITSTLGSDRGPPHIWDAATGERLATLVGHTDAVYGAAYSPDGTRIATASWDGTVRLWDAVTHEPLGEPFTPVAGTRTDPYGRRTSAVAFSPDGGVLVTGSNDGHLRWWNAQTRALIRDLEAHTSAIDSVAFSPDGARLVTGGYDDHLAKLWNAQTGTLEHVLEGHESRLMEASFSRDGTMVVTAAFDKTARLWDSDTGALLRTIRGPIHVATFHPDGHRLLTNGAGAELLEWSLDLDPRTPEQLAGEITARTAWTLREGRLVLD